RWTSIQRTKSEAQAYGAIPMKQAAVELTEGARRAAPARQHRGGRPACRDKRPDHAGNHARVTPLWTLDNAIARGTPKSQKTRVVKSIVSESGCRRSR